MKDFLKQSWKYIIPLVIGFIIGIIINIPACNKPETKIEYIPVHDTITLTHDSIIYKIKPVKEYVIDTFYVKESGDTIQLDSLPITEYRYQDTIKTDSASTEITVNYHGFNAGIDNINLVHNYYQKQTTIVKEPKKIGIVWFVGAYVGYGIHGSINTGTFGHGPEIGVGAGIGIGEMIK